MTAGIPDPHRMTIAAIATPPGTAALAIIRISGPDSLGIATMATGIDASRQESHTVKHRRILGESGDVIDDGLLAVFKAPRSQTGEDCVEFTCHGGILVAREVLSRFLACGASQAAPGEFSQRAFLNGKMDLTQVEGVMDLISSRTRLALRAARNQLDGALGRRTIDLRDELLGVLAHVEAWIDFPDEDVSPATRSTLSLQLAAVIDGITTLLSTAEQGRILREGARLVFCGLPNAGKSSLMNHFLGYDRAIVSDIAGTTRDTIEETINFHEIPLRLIDTAGVHDAGNSLEREGVRRSMGAIASADLLIEIADASSLRQPSPLPEAVDAPVILVLNKADLAEHESWKDVQAIRISCRTGTGIPELKNAILDRLHLDQSNWGAESVAINIRHRHCLLEARQSLQHAALLLDEGSWNPELVSIDLRAGLDALGEIPGKVDSEDLLGAIFSRFCIGK